MNDELQLKIRNLPDSPGCYLMREGEKIIYVGKAVNLKNRVRSYFNKQDHTPKVAAMISHITDFDILLCRSNLEALILECNLIKLHQPYYNILLKDDKHYPYIKLDPEEPYPALRLARRQEKDGARYFGPYIGSSAVRDVMETLKKIFPIRNCQGQIEPDTRKRPCINYEMGRCLGPCAGKCTREEYDRLITNVTRFLSGKQDDILDVLRARMKEAAAKLQYEQAAVIRDKIRDIEGLLQTQQAIQTNGAEQDIIASSTDGMDAMVEILFVRGGKMVGGRSFTFQGDGKEEQEELLSEFLIQYYDDEKPAREVLCMAVCADLEEDLQRFLTEKRGSACRLTVPVRGEKRALVLMAAKNASDALLKRNAKNTVQEERTVGACRELAEALHLKEPPRRMEGFDISNTMGELSTASMVVFINGVPAKEEYRSYRVKTVTGADDFASLYEVVKRRFLRAVAEDEKERWPMPDLVLIDGGREQLQFAMRAMTECGCHVPMFGLAEKTEAIYLPEREEPLILDRHSHALYLIERVRDEAHRFAITAHRSLRTKKQNHSSLEDIPGIGPARRRALLGHFRTIRAISQAEIADLAAVDGMNRTAAEKVYAAYHPEYEIPARQDDET